MQLCRETTSSLKLVQVLFRHGDRTPTETYPNDPHQSWKGGWGILTNKGKSQMYHLGKLLREQYHTFLPEYYIAENVYVKSIYADRCIMSAQTFLAGLFPPKGDQIWNPNLLWQPIPVKSVPRHLDNVIAMKKKCPVYDDALKYAYQSPKITEINDEANADLYKYLTLVTGNPINDINAVEYLYNTLEIELQNNLTLPQWTKNISLNHLRKIAELNFAIFSDTTLMKRFTGGSFLTEVISQMKKTIDHTSNLNIALFSGHDVTLITVLRTLGFERLFKPEYGAYLVFELHEANGDYEIMISFGENYETAPQQMELKFCKSPCTFNNFVKGLHPVLPDDWEAECLRY